MMDSTCVSHRLAAQPGEECRLSIIVVTWNTRELVLDCLASVNAALASPPHGARLAAEILVVDNGSADGTQEAIRERCPGVRVIALPANLGFAAGCNAGLRAIRGRHVLLLNSDARVMPETLERCVGFLDRHPDVAIVGPQLRPCSRSSSAGVFRRGAGLARSPWTSRP
jgi:GT2 family glycosyltransferase